MATEMRQLTLIKKGHYHLFRYQPGEESALMQVLVEKAEDPKCDFNWFDAAVLSHQLGHRMADEMQHLLKTKLDVTGGYNKAADAA
jgi:hypothetical protein